MRFVVCVKLTPDSEQLNEVRPEQVGSGDLGVTMVLNPWDEFAVEEALQLQARYGGATLAVTVGDEESIEALKRAVAMGVGEAVLVSDPLFQGSDAWGTAAILAAFVRSLGDASLILTGQQSVDWNNGLVGPGLAARLGVHLVAGVTRVVELSSDAVTVLRALDEGIQTVRVPLPAVLSVSKQINEPRFPNFMGIRRASRMQYPVVTAADLPDLDLSRVGAASAKLGLAQLRKPPVRRGKCLFVAGDTPASQAAALVDVLVADKVL